MASTTATARGCGPHPARGGARPRFRRHVEAVLQVAGCLAWQGVCVVLHSAIGLARTDVTPTATPARVCTTWQVGPSRPYKVPSEVAPLVQDCDRVEVDAATYL